MTMKEERTGPAALDVWPPDDMKTADKLDDLQATFIQNVQHELRTPLTLVLGYAELLQQGDLGELTPEQQRAVSLIADRAETLYGLVEHVVTLTAVQGGALAKLPLALDDLVEKGVANRQADINQAGLDLEMHLAPELPLIVGDPYRLQQAIDCLLDNAIKFTPSGGRIQVQTYATADHVCLDITDTGIGLAQREQEQIFRPFWQLDGSTTRRYDGLGLGLAVTREVIEGHGGLVTVQSQPEQGSRFTIQLPIPRKESEVDALGEKPPRQRVLIVDDEEHTRLMLQVSLEKLPNCDVAVAANGAEALEILAQQPCDLLITDYRMPNTDGLTLAAQARTLYPQMAIIMITAYSDDTLHEKAAQIAIERVLDKPVAIDEIRGVALEALHNSENSRAAMIGQTGGK